VWGGGGSKRNELVIPSEKGKNGLGVRGGGGGCDCGDPEQGLGGDGTSPVQLQESPGGRWGLAKWKPSRMAITFASESSAKAKLAVFRIRKLEMRLRVEIYFLLSAPVKQSRN
jgi:hypothetical protein